MNIAPNNHAHPQSSTGGQKSILWTMEALSIYQLDKNKEELKTRRIHTHKTTTTTISITSKYLMNCCPKLAAYNIAHSHWNLLINLLNVCVRVYEYGGTAICNVYGLLLWFPISSTENWTIMFSCNWNSISFALHFNYRITSGCAFILLIAFGICLHEFHKQMMQTNNIAIHLIVCIWKRKKTANYLMHFLFLSKAAHSMNF